jgi:hypothetical protein
MKLLTTLFFLAVPLIMQPQESSSKREERPSTDQVDRLCGRLVQSQGERKEDANGHIVEKNRSLARIPVNLYKAADSGDCCDGLSKLGSARTGLTGEFQFKTDVSPGKYWLAFHPGGHTYTILIQYDPAGKLTTKKCSELMYMLEDTGEIDLLRKNSSE